MPIKRLWFMRRSIPRFIRRRLTLGGRFNAPRIKFRRNARKIPKGIIKKA